MAKGSSSNRKEMGKEEILEHLEWRRNKKKQKYQYIQETILTEFYNDIW